MKTAIISSNYPNLIACMSPNRFVDSCETCSRVMTCKLPESASGRIRIRKEQVAQAQAELEKRKQQLIEEQNKS